MDTSYSYDLIYAYQSGAGHRFQLDNVRDLNYHTEETPSESTTVNNGHRYEYDANGNLIYVNTSRVKRDGKKDEKSTEQKFRWDEENRLLAVDENGYVSNYWYDANGERTVKESGGNEAVYVNSEFAGDRPTYVYSEVGHHRGHQPAGRKSRNATM